MLLKQPGGGMSDMSTAETVEFYREQLAVAETEQHERLASDDGQSTAMLAILKELKEIKAI